MGLCGAPTLTPQSTTRPTIDCAKLPTTVQGVYWQEHASTPPSDGGLTPKRNPMPLPSIRFRALPP